jgi:Icc-related predicted phosphoesterase
MELMGNTKLPDERGRNRWGFRVVGCSLLQTVSRYPLNRTVSIAEKYTLVSCEWVNETPWKTPRECNEKELMKKLEREFGRTDDFENLVCNFHAPPYDTNLDLAPKLSKDLKPDYSALVPVGSTSVRKSIEEHQPLLTLHGHIHESCSTYRLGRTLCVNPGSEYDSGVLRAYVIHLPELDFWRVEA